MTSEPPCSNVEVEGVGKAERVKMGKTAFWIFFFFLPLLAFGCGRKGAPVPPGAIVPAAIDDLKAERIGDQIRLSWPIAKTGGKPLSDIKGFELFKFQARDAGTLCPGCPVPFTKALTFIQFDSPSPARVKGTRMFYHDSCDPSYGYAYKVVTHHKSGGVSDDSNVVIVLPLQE